MKFILLFFLFISISYSWEPSLNEKPILRSYLFYQKEVRFTILNFPNRFISISEHCVIKKDDRYNFRDCYAWDLYEAIEDGRMNKRLYNRDIRRIKTRRELGYAICMEADGYVDTEKNEYSLQSGFTDLEDFCVFHDHSVVTIQSIVQYYLYYSGLKL